MDRRNFFKIISATSAGALTTSCTKTDHLIPLLVAEDDLIPGVEQWHPAVCAECGAGCGTLVRIMEGQRVIEQNGEPVRERRAAIKKIEGNPLDPVSGGRLCARGQAVVQALYHPDRLRGPMKRTANRGQAQFAAISWDEALGSAAERIAQARAADPGGIVFLTGAQVGTRSLAIQRFTAALGAPEPVVCSIADFPVERKAAEMVFGWKGLPVYDLAKATYALGVGADFLGGWASPVYYARQFGAFRQGRTGVRGRLIQAESRLSLTAGSADRWLALRPGTEPQFLMAVGRMLIDANLARNRDGVPKAVLVAFQSADVTSLLGTCGLEERKVRPMVIELGESDAPVLLGGASVVHSNSLASVLASHYVNMLLGNIEKSGGVLAPAAGAAAPAENHRVADALARAQVVLVDDSNPMYTLPPSSGIQQALTRARSVISLAPFLDDTGAWADLLLPGNHVLESETALVPSVAAKPSLAVGTPFVRALHDTRPMEQVLAQLAERLKVEYKPGTASDLAEPMLGENTFEDVARRGGLWTEVQPEKKTRSAPRPPEVKLEIAAAGFAGDATQFPLHFQPYLSLQYHDGRASNLPWMQELPDPASSAVWGLPVEIDPRTAAAMGIANGDLVRVESPHGSIEAPAYVHPGAVPGVVSMGIGDGHAHYGRYASDEKRSRGANPMTILAAAWEASTGALILGGTRVRLTRIGKSDKLIQYAHADREHRDFSYR